MRARRHLLLCLFMSALASLAQGQKPLIRLWEGTPVKAKSVTLAPFLPASSAAPSVPAPAVIICPGGSYCWLDYDAEGTHVAQWLQGEGIAAFVLKYRVQGFVPYILHTRLLARGHQHPDALCDVQRAIQYLREHADDMGIDAGSVGVMGFSAGGHLSMSAAAFAATDFLAPLGISHDVSLRPDFVASIYPVVTMNKPYTHKRSRRALLGEYRKHNSAMRDSLSLERHITDVCSPVFLLNCADDHIVNPRNSELLDSALTARHIPHTYVRYTHGRHGFGVMPRRMNAETAQWQETFLSWLRSLAVCRHHPEER